MKRNSPPEPFLRFFRWYCHPKMQDYIEGDLMEVYDRRVRQSGKQKADFKFIIDVLLLCRPGIIRSATPYTNVNNSGMIKNYLKIGWRNLIRNKGYAAINIAGLALSMTCGILIFSLVMYHLNFDNFHFNPDRTYRIVTELHRDVVDYRNCVPSPLGGHFRNDFALSEKIARIYTQRDVQITIKKNEELIKLKETQGISFTEVEFFDIFNFPLSHGNSKTALLESNTAILTEKAARKYFGNENPMGEVFWLDNTVPFTVTGILKDLPDNTDIQSQVFVSWSSLKSYDSWLAHETDGWGGIRSGMECYTVLKHGVTPAQVEEVLLSYVKRFRPNSKNTHHYNLQPLNDVHFNAHYDGVMEKGKLWTMSIIGVFLIGTACLNFINLATAQALKRSKEVGVRKVLGGFKRQLFWQFISETAIITLIGIVLAIFLTILVTPMMSNLFNLYIPLNLLADKTIFFSLLLGTGITFIAGYYPAMILSGFQPVTALKGKLSQQRMGRFNTRRTLIVTQFVISQVLIIGMIVIMSQMRYTQKADLGFTKDAIVMIDLGSDSTQTKATILKNEISRLAGVENASLCYTAPASDEDWGNAITFDNSSEEVNFRTSVKSVDSDYLATFNLQLVAGRNLTPSDTVREMLVNETLIYKLGLTAEEVLGRKISANGGEMKGPIVGVVKDFHDKSFRQDINAILFTTSYENYYRCAVKLNLANAKSILGDIEKMWSEQHPDQIFNYQFLDDHIAHFYETEETMLRIIQVFAFIAIFIGCLGLYGLVSFMVVQKTKEVGIRKVLGSSVSGIVGLFGKELIKLIIIASLIAAPLGWWFMNNWLQEFKFRITITPAIFALAIGFTVLITVCTVSYQVIKSAIANPVKSLRSE